MPASPDARHTDYRSPRAIDEAAVRLNVPAHGAAAGGCWCETLAWAPVVGRVETFGSEGPFRWTGKHLALYGCTVARDTVIQLCSAPNS